MDKHIIPLKRLGIGYKGERLRCELAETKLCNKQWSTANTTFCANYDIIIILQCARQSSDRRQRAQTQDYYRRLQHLGKGVRKSRNK